MKKFKEITFDIGYVIIAGFIVAFASYMFQNSNNFAPGGIGGLATIVYHLTDDRFPWAFWLILFNAPIFILMAIFVDKKLGLILLVYICAQGFGASLMQWLNIPAYCKANNGEDYEIIIACIATGVISGVGFSMTLRRFGASGGTYAISALIKKVRPEANIAYLSFIMDSSVVLISFFSFGMNITSAIGTLINLFIANVVVDVCLSGLKNGYKFEIITDRPDELSEELLTRLKHGVTSIKVEGMYSKTDRTMLICIIRKKQVGEMYKIIKKYGGTFADVTKVNEVFGKFAK